MQYQYQQNLLNNQKMQVPNQDDLSFEAIVKEIDSLDRKNKKLLSIADNIMKTSFLRQADQTPAVILQLEEDMKVSFNQLIESIRQFFISIDSQLKQLGVALQQRMADPFELSRTKFSNKSEGDKVETLTLRMGMLEENMKRAQENETRLISIIEEMNAKKGCSDQQPTILKEPKGFRLAAGKNNLNSSMHQESSFRLFSIGQNSQKILNDPVNEPYPTYKRFQQYSQFPVIESMGPQPIKSPQMSPYFCNVRQQVQQIVPRYGNVIKTNGQRFQMENSNRIHRLSNLMKALKQ